MNKFDPSKFLQDLPAGRALIEAKRRAGAIRAVKKFQRIQKRLALNPPKKVRRWQVPPRIPQWASFEVMFPVDQMPDFGMVANQSTHAQYIARDAARARFWDQPENVKLLQKA